MNGLTCLLSVIITGNKYLSDGKKLPKISKKKNAETEFLEKKIAKYLIYI